MKKSINIYLRIILIFTVVLLMSTITEQCPDLLGDWRCKGSGKLVTDGEYTHHWTQCNYNIGPTEDYHSSTLHYGFRHYVVIFMGISLFIFQVVNLINFINKSYKFK